MKHKKVKSEFFLRPLLNFFMFRKSIYVYLPVEPKPPLLLCVSDKSFVISI